MIVHLRQCGGICHHVLSGGKKSNLLFSMWHCMVIINTACSSDSAHSCFSESLSIYDDIDADVLRNYQEFTLANILYYSLKESTTSEQSARMTAMDNASKNACKSTLDFLGFQLLMSLLLLVCRFWFLASWEYASIPCKVSKLSALQWIHGWYWWANSI